MPALTTANITWSKVDEDFMSIANKMVIWDITFGNGALTYPSGGVPIASSVNAFGLKKTIKFVHLSPPSGNGYIYKWVYSDTAPKVRIYQSPGDAVVNHTHTITAHGHNLSITSAAAAATDTFDELSALGIVFASGNALQRTKTGAAATVATTTTALTTAAGGSAAADAAALAEVTTSHAPASTTIRLMVVGE